MCLSVHVGVCVCVGATLSMVMKGSRHTFPFWIFYALWTLWLINANKCFSVCDKGFVYISQLAIVRYAPSTTSVFWDLLLRSEALSFSCRGVKWKYSNEAPLTQNVFSLQLKRKQFRLNNQIIWLYVPFYCKVVLCNSLRVLDWNRFRI